MILYLHNNGCLSQNLHSESEGLDIVDMNIDLPKLFKDVEESEMHPDISPEEKTCDRICQSINAKIEKPFKHLIIELSEDKTKINLPFAVMLASHIALHPFTNFRQEEIAINIIGHEELSLKALNESPVLNFFYLSGTEYWEKSIAFERIKDPILEKEQYAIVRHLKKGQPHFLNAMDLDIKAHIDSRHGIANQWGALILAENAGLKPEDIDYEFPPTLYFKKLLWIRNHALENRKKITRTQISCPELSVLLVDDDASKGWQQVLELIFGNKIYFAKELQSLDLDEKEFFKLIAKKVDLIFLDLNLPEKNGLSPHYRNGYKALQIMKRECPHIPIIIFTASNKARTLTKIMNEGADGMFIKDSPDTVYEPETSRKNYTNLIKDVIEIHKNYQFLKPFYFGINQIIESTYFKNNLKDKNSWILRARIEERLKMFYGLLKRGFEQTRFNRDTFYFSDKKLAFITLWSILNEISEIYFDKSNGNDRDKIREWRLRDKSSYLIKRGADGKQKTYIDWSDNSYTILNSPIENKSRVESKISLQIAFIIKSLQISKTERKKYWENLYQLNNYRNKLFIIHGDDIDQDFYKHTEEYKDKDDDKSDVVSKNITSLFQIVYLLLTNTNCDLEFK